MIILGIILIILTFKNKRDIKLNKETNNPNICFLIPARDESKVIEALILSILNQTININLNNVYVIVESITDKTVSICQKYNVSTIVRKNLNLKTKGYALDEALKNIDKKYDLYFIVDADNILDFNFVKEMLNSYKEGYDIAIGYRNLKNGSDSLIAASSGLTFSFLNNILNKSRNKNNIPVLLSGTGFYIKGNIINKFNGYPFHSLTEDYELTLYSILNSLNTTYNEKAIFYDEQPIKFKDTINQRRRWIKGYFINRKKYIPLFKKSVNNSIIKTEIIGVKPYIILIIGIIFWIIYFLLKHNLLMTLLILLFIYVILVLITIIDLKKDVNININKKMRKKLIWYFPIYLFSYVLIALSVLLNPKVEWKKVEHNRNI